MNAREESQADAVAFAIARGLALASGEPGGPYDYMIRGLKFGPRAMIGGHRREQEYDILGVRIEPFEVDCFEVKLGCAGRANAARNQRRELRQQLEDRRSLGLFTHVYGCLEHDGPIATEKAAVACGTLWVRGGVSALHVEVAERAVRLDVDQGREWERFRSKLFQFRTAHEASVARFGGPVVFLRCPACGPFNQFFYGHWVHAPQEYAKEGESSPHSPFCPNNPERAASIAQAFHETHLIVNDQWRTTTSSAEYLGVVRLW